MKNPFNQWACELQLNKDGRISPSRKNTILRVMGEMARELPDDARMLFNEHGEMMCYSAGQLHKVEVIVADDAITFKSLEAKTVQEISDDEIDGFDECNVVAVELAKGGFCVVGYEDDEDFRSISHCLICETYPQAYRAAKAISEVREIPLEDQVFENHHSR